MESRTELAAYRRVLDSGQYGWVTHWKTTELDGGTTLARAYLPAPPRKFEEMTGPMRTRCTFETEAEALAAIAAYRMTKGTQI